MAENEKVFDTAEETQREQEDSNLEKETESAPELDESTPQQEQNQEKESDGDDEERPVTQDDSAMAAIRASGRRYRYCNDDVYGEGEEPAGTGENSENAVSEYAGDPNYSDERLTKYFADRPENIQRAGRELFAKYSAMNTDSVFIEYMLTKQNAYEAVNLVEKRKKSRLVQLILIPIVTVLFAVSYFVNHLTNDLILGIACLALFVFVLVTPHLAGRSAMKMTDPVRQNFILVGDKSIFSCNGDSYYKFERGKDKLTVLEKDNMFILLGGKGVTYCVPKALVPEEKLQRMRELLADSTAAK